MIDTLRPVSLPEGAEITLRLAGPVARARAWFIDFALRAVVGLSLPAIFLPLGEAGMGLMLIAFFAISMLYPVFFEALWDGATPGKRICGLAVVHADGTPVGWPAAFLRNVVRIADAFPIGYAFGLACMLVDRQFRRFGDLAAGTLVIHRETARGSARRAATVPPLAPRVALTPLEQRAVLDFAERRAGWSQERAAELAELAAPLVAGAGVRDPVARLEAIAAHLVSRR